MFTPERTIDIERDIGADIIMPLDVCVEYPTTHAEADRAERQTYRWAERAKKHWQSDPRGQTLFGIVQGSVFPDLRSRAVESLVGLDFPGYAIGGLSVGEPKSEMIPMLELLNEHLPQDKPRYLMGVGTPADIIRGIDRGIDMFDCVLPTRNARNGSVFTRNGTLIIKAAAYSCDYRPIDEACGCLCCRGYSRAYLRHLLNVNEIAGLRLLTIHNLYLYLELVRLARQAIIADEFARFRDRFFADYNEEMDSQRINEEI
jgi:queuine tRNA-ribosyltransferase